MIREGRPPLRPESPGSPEPSALQRKMTRSHWLRVTCIWMVSQAQAFAMASLRFFWVSARWAISMGVGLKIRLKITVQTAATTTAA